MATQQKKDGFWAVVLPFILGEASDLLHHIFQKKDLHQDDNTLAVKEYLQSLDTTMRAFVISEMVKTDSGIRTNAECSNPCTGQGSTPYGHWSHDAQCNCVWVPEFGG